MRYLVPLFCLGIVATVACSHAEKRPEEETEQKTPVSLNPAPDAGASMETKQVAAESDAPFSTELHFAKKSALLSPESSGRLKKILKEAKTVGTVDQIEVYAWSDQEYPGDQTKALPIAAQKLATARGEAIRDFYKKIDGAAGDQVKIINMAMEPSGLKAALNLGDTSEKKQFADAGIKTTDKKTMGAAKRSRVAVMIRLKR